MFNPQYMEYSFIPTLLYNLARAMSREQICLYTSFAASIVFTVSMYTSQDVRSLVLADLNSDIPIFALIAPINMLIWGRVHPGLGVLAAPIIMIIPLLEGLPEDLPFAPM